MSRRFTYYGSGSSGILPGDLSGLICWLDATDTSTINGGSPSNNDTVSIIKNKAVAGVDDFIQSVATKQPTWKTTGMGVNSLPSIEFDGIDNNLNLDPPSASMTTASFSLYMMLESDGGEKQFWKRNRNAGGSNANHESFFDTSGSSFFQARKAGDNQTESFTIISGDNITSYRFDSIGVGTSLMEVDLNNVNKASSTTKSPMDTNNNFIEIGSGGGFFTAMKFSEVLFYDRFLTNQENSDIYDYFNNKYNL